MEGVTLMRLLECTAMNFASYSTINFNFDNQELTLINGTTGSGKSTLLDLPMWILFGVTAKQGLVDNVRNWKDKSLTTSGILEVEANGEMLKVVRIRGSSNDLYIETPTGQVLRGKDLNETQLLISRRLGVDVSSYCLASYFNDYSVSTRFFTSSSGERRAMLENLVPLDLPVLLAEKATEAKKIVKAELVTAENGINKHNGQIELTEKFIISNKADLEVYEDKRKDIVISLTVQSKNFNKIKQSKIDALTTSSSAWEQERTKKLGELIETLNKLESSIRSTKHLEHKLKMLPDNTCKMCGQETTDKAEVQSKIEKINLENECTMDKIDLRNSQLTDTYDAINPYLEQIKQAHTMVNTFAHSAAETKAAINPHLAKAATLDKSLNELKKELSALYITRENLIEKRNDLDSLQEASLLLRKELLSTSLSELQDKTNDYLDKYFESEFQVEFTFKNGDNIDVAIHKNGHQCSFSQLSKGQKQLLKLSFAVSIMELCANNLGLHFNALFFDEALDGLDSNFKLKAFRVFEHLATISSSVFVVDHDTELKQLFNNKYTVTMVDDNSEIEYES